MTKFAAALAGLALSVACGSAALADPVRAYDNGAVWQLSYVIFSTKPGHFDDYMRYLSGAWRATQEALKRQGQVLDYKILNLADARDGEPDVILMVEWKNMAAFDNAACGARRADLTGVRLRFRRRPSQHRSRGHAPRRQRSADSGAHSDTAEVGSRYPPGWYVRSMCPVSWSG